MLLYAVLAFVSKRYPPHKGRLLTRYSPVRHWSFPEGKSPFDLNVLCTPPAFILSQDQTLELIVSYLTYRQLKSIRAFFLSFFYFLESCTLFKLTDLYFALFMLCTCLCCSIVKVQFAFSWKQVPFGSMSRILRSFVIIPHLICFVKRFFKVFLKNFLWFLSRRVFSTTTFIFYHIPFPLSIVFLKFFKIFFKVSKALVV